ncbi:OPT oligopeptide transporter protein-domain-containing protein [Mrakia frigida]|uniref:OPT family oligopeptide transporter n=1 Tax=Mrakia frigida TaxID=29902 RepID=UPI003FCC2701
MSTHPSVGIDGVQPDIAILTSAFTDARTKRERDGIPVEEDLDDEKRSLDSNEKDLDEKRKVSIRVQPVDEEGVRWAGGDETLQAAGDDDDPEYANIPMIVRELCDFEDDPSTPIMTWRFYILSGIFTALGAWTTYIPYSIYFVQIASLYFGRLLAATLPKRIIGRGRFSFQLNPGPFSVKEHVAIVLAANTGATNNMGDYVLAPLDVFYNKPMNGWLAILFMWSAVFVGFAYASFARRFLIDDPQIIFPLTVQQVSVFRWNYFFSYVAYIGAFVSLALFQGPMLWKSAKAQFRGERLHKDRLCNLMLAYPTVPWQWNVALFVIPVIILICLTATGILYMPIYALFVALAFGAAIVVPMAYIYAVSGYTTQVGYFNEIVYGYLINLGGSRHPIGSLSYRVISGQAWYEACAMLSDMKASRIGFFSFLAHYFHVPPRQTLLSQIWGIVIGVPVNYLTIKRDFLTGLKMDPQRQWTGQTVISLNNQGIQFALVGPKRLFADDAYTPLLYGFVLGAALPFLLYGLHRFFPRARFDLWSVTIFCTNMETFYGNISNNFFTKYLLGCVNFYIKRNKYEFWKKYAYLAGAAADTGYNLNMLFLFIAFSAVKTINMPHWWGNNADSVESCFPAST